MFPLLDTYDPISLQEMKAVRLMNRIDTKFVTTLPLLLRLLEEAQSEYLVQEADGLRAMPYYTRYYDTPECRMYLEHLHGRLKREKIRIRRYESSGAAFLEVKAKDNRGRTNKERVPCEGLGEAARAAFVAAHSHYRLEALSPRVENRFTRITLVNRRLTERLTVDVELRFRNLLSGRLCALDRLAVIELKRDGRTRSPAAELLRRLHIHPAGFSKYCMGMALTDETLARNRFKPRLRAIGRMSPVRYGAEPLFDHL